MPHLGLDRAHAALAAAAAASCALVSTSGSASAHPPTLAGQCAASAYAAQNLSGLAIQGAREASTNTTAARCLASCCADPRCTAWNYHAASTDPSHHPHTCWLTAAPTPSAEPAQAVDTWVGGSRHPVTCPGGRPCGAPAIPSCDGTNYTQCRRELWRYVFNTTDGELPSRTRPDWVEDLADWEMKGLPGPGQGTGVGNVSWRMGLQKLTWAIGGAGGGMQEGMLRLNSTVWYSRNTSGAAPSNSPPAGYGLPKGDSPHCPDASRPGYDSWAGRSDTLVIHHNGHSPCAGGEHPRTTGCSDCGPNFDTMQDWFNQLG